MKNKFTPTGILEINNTLAIITGKSFCLKKIEGYMLVQDKKNTQSASISF